MRFATRLSSCFRGAPAPALESPVNAGGSTPSIARLERRRSHVDRGTVRLGDLHSGDSPGGNRVLITDADETHGGHGCAQRNEDVLELVAGVSIASGNGTDLYMLLSQARSLQRVAPGPRGVVAKPLDPVVAGQSVVKFWAMRQHSRAGAGYVLELLWPLAAASQREEEPRSHGPLLGKFRTRVKIPRQQ